MFIVWNDGLQTRNRKPMLFIGRGDRIELFLGKSIPELVAVSERRCTENGKWSNTDYKLLLSSGAWVLESEQDFESGHRFGGCVSVAGMVKMFREAGCAATDRTIIAALETHCPRTIERVRRTEDEIASVHPGK